MLVKLVSVFRIISTSIIFYRKFPIRSNDVDRLINISTSLLYYRQNRKLRDSSNESEDEIEVEPSSPAPRSIVDDTKNVLPSQIKAVAVNQ